MEDEVRMLSKEKNKSLAYGTRAAKYSFMFSLVEFSRLVAGSIGNNC
jgi:hypothetical protein